MTLPRWHVPATIPRPALYAVAIMLITLCLGYGFSDPQFWFFGWAWLLAPTAIVAGILYPTRRSLILAVGAAALALFTTGESVYLALAVAALVFLSLMEDPAPRPKVGLIAGLVGGIGPSLGGAPPFPAIAASLGAYAFASLLRWHERNAGLTAELLVETDELRTQATWLEQRTALARELHDVVGHHVTAMVVQAEAGQVADPESALHRIAETGRAALRELDALVVHLRDPHAAITMTAPPRLGDIDEILAEPLRQHGVTVSVAIDADHGLDEVGSLAVYRVAQEALTNITRHARATSAWVEVRRLAAHVRLRVSDDGIGPPAYVERGAGLVGITERVAALQGTFEMSSRPGGGTMVDVVLPVGEA
ncbi:hypothetical protein GCM10011584_24150 [Nocardioides phosphati]|uniref:histidine kinase n=1 Tax=Nocardioides phosphati TaxID=1867775 RepID=A0ABQ2NCN4_9ACTN|nr:ATP-binding protein [Nocardioides phosphati]GGO91032.1 hypothetical protein GCM10011584_24150 [Nocardioides phosphati]